MAGTRFSLKAPASLQGGLRRLNDFVPALLQRFRDKAARRPGMSAAAKDSTNLGRIDFSTVRNETLNPPSFSRSVIPTFTPSISRGWKKAHPIPIPARRCGPASLL